jgi:hypothetical protein
MKFLLGVIIGAALGFALASLLSRQHEDEEISWAGDDSGAPMPASGDGKAAPAAI